MRPSPARTPRERRGPGRRCRRFGAAPPRQGGTWGDDSVSSCRSYSPAKLGPRGASAVGAFPMARSLSGDAQGVLDGARRGPVGPPGPLELAALVLAAGLGGEKVAAHRRVGVGVVDLRPPPAGGAELAVHEDALLH
jgi:hypothetical protein